MCKYIIKTILYNRKYLYTNLFGVKIINIFILVFFSNQSAYNYFLSRFLVRNTKYIIGINKTCQNKSYMLFYLYENRNYRNTFLRRTIVSNSPKFYFSYFQKEFLTFQPLKVYHARLYLNMSFFFFFFFVFFFFTKKKDIIKKTERLSDELKRL